MGAVMLNMRIRVGLGLESDDVKNEEFEAPWCCEGSL